MPDMLERIGHYAIELRPLRERRDEVLPLVREVLDRESRVIG